MKQSRIHMDHVAIMRKSWKLIPKILDGRKVIESRWSVNKVAPWGKVKTEDTIYFKNSGEKIIAKAEVSKVIQFNDLNPGKVKSIIDKYGDEGQISFNDKKNSFNWAKNKKYCTLIYLKNAREVKPFGINKKGFRTGAAWLIVADINSLRLKT